MREGAIMPDDLPAQAAPPGVGSGSSGGPVGGTRVPGAGLVGYYDMPAFRGQDYEVPPIQAAGGTAVLVDDPSSAELANLDALFVLNSSNFDYSLGYTSRLADITAAVQSGMVLVIHDRLVDGAARILPNGSTFSTLPDLSEGADINLLDTTTAVTSGLDDSSLDLGIGSNRGYALDGTLPITAKRILGATKPSHIVTFCYSLGKGAVIYSTIPLDFYLSFPDAAPPGHAFADVYAPNVVRYAMAGACSVPRGGPRPTPN